MIEPMVEGAGTVTFLFCSIICETFCIICAQLMIGLDWTKLRIQLLLPNYNQSFGIRYNLENESIARLGRRANERFTA
jgi:hypothetical protein